MQHVIVGAGPAGVIAAETLVRLDPDSDVVVVGDEPGPPYSRMAIPYYLTGMIDEAGTRIRKTANHYQDLGIRVVQGRAESVAAADGRLTLEGGESLAFDRLLVATGASAVKPPVPGLDADGVHHCWTLADARAIAALAGPGADVVLMGAGFIGCIILQSLAARGVNLTVVEAEDRMVPRMMDATGGAMIKRWCEEKGVRVLTEAPVTGVEPAAGGSADKWVVLEGGDKLKAQLVVVATGVRSNMDFLAGSGVKTDIGVLVDEQLRTNVENIFAAGDAAQGPDISTGGWSVHAIQTTAADHGRIAALNMAGRPAAYKGSLIMNVLDTVGLISCSFGRWSGADGGESATAVDEANFKYMRLEFEDDRLVGALSLGRTDHVGVIRGLIQTRISLGPWKKKLIADPHRILEAYIACSQPA